MRWVVLYREGGDYVMMEIVDDCDKAMKKAFKWCDGNGRDCFVEDENGGSKMFFPTNVNK